MLRNFGTLSVYRAPDTGDGGGASAGTGTGAAGDGGAGDGGAEGEPKTVPQDQVTAIAARERAQGERAAAAKVAEALGMTVEEAKTFIDGAKERERAAMTEADRKLAEATDKEKAATAATAKAAEREHNANVRVALIDAGVPKAKAERAARLVDAAIGADDAAIKTSIESLKGDWPEMFATVEEGEGDDGKGGANGDGKTKGKATSGTPGGKPPARADSKPTDALARGAERARTDMAKRGIKVPEPAGTGS
jgi:hypothetical protein